jgi:indole-3-glycerol phosphate synthase
MPGDFEMSETFFDKILALKRERVERLKRQSDISDLVRRAYVVRQSAAKFRLRTELNRTDRTNIIAEIKRASPSKGVINDRIDVTGVAQSYSDGGAAAISVLTEEDFFKGSLDDLIKVRSTVDLPILRKDFTLDEFQIYESAAAGADAVLLIAAALDKTRLKDLLFLAENELGMDAVVEVHTAGELEAVNETTARIIGINNRDLKTFSVSLDVSRQLILQCRDGSVTIAESGLSTLAEIEALKDLGFSGFLIGETLMKNGDALQLLRSWTRQGGVTSSGAADRGRVTHDHY